MSGSVREPDYSKMDPGLQIAYSGEGAARVDSMYQEPFKCLVNTVVIPSEEERAILRSNGVYSADRQNTTIFTARVTREQLVTLTNQPFVRVLSLSRRLRFLGVEKNAQQVAQ